MTKSSLTVPLFFFAIFLIVIGVVLFGAFYYKNTPTETTVISNNSVQIEESIEPTVERDPVRLRLIPTDAEQTTYKVVVDSVTMPITGIAFQLMISPDGSRLISNTVETSSELESSGWTTAVNTSSDTDNSQELSFSMISSTPGNTEVFESIEIGTISFDTTPSVVGLSLNTEESLVTYGDNSISPVTLLLETEP